MILLGLICFTKYHPLRTYTALMAHMNFSDMFLEYVLKNISLNVNFFNRSLDTLVSIDFMEINLFTNVLSTDFL